MRSTSGCVFVHVCKYCPSRSVELLCTQRQPTQQTLPTPLSFSFLLQSWTPDLLLFFTRLQSLKSLLLYLSEPHATPHSFPLPLYE